MSNETKWTGGEWRAKPWSEKESEIVSVVDGKATHITGYALNADANLIASAPALYEALTRIAYLRPAGDVKTAKNARALVEKIECIALAALKSARGE